MLLWLVIGYLVISIGIGVYAATRVHDARDYIVAGRNLPFPIVLAMVFATWFGAETVLGISATFIEEGFRGLISDPLGASLCLVLFGLIFARPLYRLNLLTLGDFFRARYNRSTEVVLSLCILVGQLAVFLLGPATGALVREGLIILGWVANWKPFQTFLYDWIPIVRRQRLLRRLADAHVEVVPIAREGCGPTAPPRSQEVAR